MHTYRQTYTHTYTRTYTYTYTHTHVGSNHLGRTHVGYLSSSVQSWEASFQDSSRWLWLPLWPVSEPITFNCVYNMYKHRYPAFVSAMQNECFLSLLLCFAAVAMVLTTILDVACMSHSSSMGVFLTLQNIVCHLMFFLVSLCVSASGAVCMYLKLWLLWESFFFFELAKLIFCWTNITRNIILFAGEKKLPRHEPMVHVLAMYPVSTKTHTQRYMHKRYKDIKCACTCWHGKRQDSIGNMIMAIALGELRKYAESQRCKEALGQSRPNTSASLSLDLITIETHRALCLCWFILYFFEGTRLWWYFAWSSARAEHWCAEQITHVAQVSTWIW